MYVNYQKSTITTKTAKSYTIKWIVSFTEVEFIFILSLFSTYLNLRLNKKKNMDGGMTTWIIGSFVLDQRPIIILTSN